MTEPMGFFGIPISEEMRAEMEEKRRQWEMEVDDRTHAQDALFEELPREHLYTLALLFRAISHTEPEEAVRIAARYDGIASTTLKYRFGVCPGCNKNHEEEAMKIFVAEGGGPKDSDPEWKFPEPKADAVSTSLPMKGASVPSFFEDDEKNSEPDERDALSPEDIANMVVYNLDDLRDEDTHELLGFICKGCGRRYVSIEDRMLREPGVKGCGGCQDKAKWG